MKSFFLVLALATICQAVSLENGALSSFQELGQKLKKDIEGVQKLYAMVEGHNVEMNQMILESISKIGSVPEGCQVDLPAELELLVTRVAASDPNCTDATTVVNNIKDLMMAGLQVVGDVSTITKSISTSFTGCAGVNPVSVIICFARKIAELEDSIKSIKGDVQAFEKEYELVATEIKFDFSAECRNRKNETLHAEVGRIMTTLQTCVGEKKHN